jgi:protein-S-isoprenylcysteine O-methyltransferase Ste14
MRAMEVAASLPGGASGLSRRLGLIPLVVGVTGHRNPDPAAVGSVEAEIERIFSRLDLIAPNTPIVLLSPLAAGADRIATRVALRFRRRRPDAGIEVLCPFPLELEDYRRDFVTDADDAAQFESLLSRVDGWYSLPAPDGFERDGSGYVAAGPARDLCYRRLGLYIALQSHVMIAMWDGQRTDRVGGTSEIVGFCLGERPSRHECGIPFRTKSLLLAPPESTPVVCVPTPRAGGGAPSETVHMHSLDRCIAQALPTIRAINDLNRGLIRIGPQAPSSAQMRGVLAEPVNAGIAGPWSDMAQRFLRLDALAAQAKRMQVRAAKAIPSAACVGLGCFQWFGSVGLDEFRATAWVSLVLYMLFVTTAVLLWWWVSIRCRVEWTFIHARALAEAMRVQMAWTGSGIEQVAPDLYAARRSDDLRQLRGVLRAAVLEVGIVSARGGLGGAPSRGLAWIADQADYFVADSPGMRRRHRNVARISKALAVLKGVAVTLSLALVGLAALSARYPELLDWKVPWLCFIVACVLVLTIGVSYWQGVTLDQEDLEIASRMRQVFRAARESLGRQGSDPHAILRAAGNEALDEHAEWFVRHRDRLKMPDVV